MPHAPTLSRSAQHMLANPAAKGARHEQIVRLSCELKRCGHSDEEIFWRLRHNYDADVSDSEIRKVISWAKPGTTRTNSRSFRSPTAAWSVRMPPVELSPVEKVQRFLKGRQAGEADIWEASPIRLLDDWQNDSRLFVSELYQTGERINIVSTSQGDSGKPIGRGRTLTREQWLAEFERGIVVKGSAGAWVRMNPVDECGVSDVNVAHHRFLLLEFDDLPLDLQLSFFAFLPVPISALIASGGRSIHAWVRIDAPDSDEYRETAKEVFQLLTRVGVDKANRNPSRLSRLPGVKRGKTGIQRLLYLDPSRSKSTAIL